MVVVILRGSSYTDIFCFIFTLLNWMMKLENTGADFEYLHNDSSDVLQHNVPFIVIGSVASDGLYIYKALNEHREKIASSLTNMERAYRVAKESEIFMFGFDKEGSLSTSLEKRIAMIATLLETDFEHLEKELLRPIPIIHALPEPFEMDTLPLISMQSTGSEKVNEDTISSYNSVVHVISHIVRDWTEIGNKIPYQWCVNKLSILYPIPAHKHVLVPGAGLGRLAWEVSRAGFTVEANEYSLVMSTAAYNILNRGTSGVIHPFCYDSMLNEIDPLKRYDSIYYPHLDTNFSTQVAGQMSYTIGDFVDAYLLPSKQSSFDTIITCFFIDTASNIFEYIHVMKFVLRNGGYWINYGPLQWHGNALITPSVVELKDIVQNADFEVLEWEVDDDLINYRSNEDNSARFTKMEGYHSLKFTLKYKGECSFIFGEISCLRENIQRATVNGKYFA